MPMHFTGRVWIFGDDIDTDLIQPTESIRLPAAERRLRVFSANRPGWAEQVQEGDILVGGRNFGMGSGRPALGLREVGLSCLLAETINGLFFRNCVNYAFPALRVPGIAEAFEEGDQAEVDFEAATVRNQRTGAILEGTPWPAKLLETLQAGGLIASLEAQGLLRPA